ncbi:hypothetical protein B2J86_12730, partial [Acidovorax sp. SRB_14]|nr:hypothetical protein [Acidovorax sp. SRB_14]
MYRVADRARRAPRWPCHPTCTGNPHERTAFHATRPLCRHAGGAARRLRPAAALALGGHRRAGRERAGAWRHARGAAARAGR